MQSIVRRGVTGRATGEARVAARGDFEGGLTPGASVTPRPAPVLAATEGAEAAEGTEAPVVVPVGNASASAALPAAGSEEAVLEAVNRAVHGAVQGAGPP